jgi:hypothetical protein
VSPRNVMPQVFTGLLQVNTQLQEMPRQFPNMECAPQIRTFTETFMVVSHTRVWAVGACFYHLSYLSSLQEFSKFMQFSICIMNLYHLK